MDDRELLIRYRDGDLSEEETARIDARLRGDARLKSRLENLDELAAVLEQGAADSFGPFFATRVMARIRRSDAAAPVEGMYESLRWMFARAVVACLVMAIGIGLYSAIGGGYGGSMVDAMLGLPEATLETALTLGG
jgi:anti-sigma factor RsiW